MAQRKRYYPWWTQFGQKVLKLLEHEPDELAHAAWELINNRLPPLTEHVVLSAQLQSLSLRVLAHAISPTGKVAILMARDDFSCGLITWSQEEGLREQSQRELWNYTERLPLGVFFPTGSEEPLVYFGELGEHDDGHDNILNIRWGDYHHWQYGSRSITEVSACMEKGILYITFRLGKDYTLLQHNFRTKKQLPIRTNDNMFYRWFGCIDGKVTKISTDGIETLYWHGIQIAMPDETHRIDEATISHAYGGVQLVSLTEGHTHLWWSDGETTNSVCLQDVDITRKEGLLTSNQGQEVFIKDGLYPLSVADAERIMIAPEGSKPPLQVSERDGTVCIEFMSTELDAQKRTIQYPLYGPYFPILTIVEHRHERYLLGFYLVTGTLHIIRYPII